MHFYSHLITIMYPFVVINNESPEPPDNTRFVVDYLGRQVVTHNNDFVIAAEE